ncbi:MAG: uroporphyrinogen decarboxylase family protein [Candidatus Cloacimonetes bacterium]|nr:uroporphyrinogen decarboxylase family protein [Candidatus Cloacimonadota bacterium]
MDLFSKCLLAFQQKKRLVAPLLGYPGLQLTKYDKITVQSQHLAHYETIKALFHSFKPDILFPLMDLSLEVNALGKPGAFHLPAPSYPINDDIDQDNLHLLHKQNILADTRLKEYLQTLHLITRNLAQGADICAYCSAPFTLAGQILGLDNISLKILLEPDFIHELLQICTDQLAIFVKEMIDTGISAICFLDPTAGLISPSQTAEFALGYLQKLITLCRKDNIDAIIHICGNTTQIIPLLAQTNASALSLDSPATGIDLPEIVKHIPQEMILLGNINPTGKILTGTPEEVKNEVTQLLSQMQYHPNFILSTGCDLPQNTPLSNIDAFFSF